MVNRKLFTFASIALLGLSFLAKADALELNNLTSADALEEEMAIDSSGGVENGDFGIEESEREGRGDFRQREFICYARNARGMTFRARGEFPRRTQERALDKCRYKSFVCVASGCERI